jgi:hypothetical protein
MIRLFVWLGEAAFRLPVRAHSFEWPHQRRAREARQKLYRYLFGEDIAVTETFDLSSQAGVRLCRMRLFDAILEKDGELRDRLSNYINWDRPPLREDRHDILCLWELWRTMLRARKDGRHLSCESRQMIEAHLEALKAWSEMPIF